MEHTRLVQCLVELRAELESGQQVMAELDSKRATLTNTILRISGAIQVPEELRAQEERTGGNGFELMDRRLRQPWTSSQNRWANWSDRCDRWLTVA